MKRSLLTSAAVLTAAGLSAAGGALVRRILRNSAVQQATRISAEDAGTGPLPVLPSPGSPPAGADSENQKALPVTPVPRDTVTAVGPGPGAGMDTSDAEVPGADSGDPLEPADPADPGADSGEPAGPEDPRPARTWVVDNSSDWDGSPLELVVSPAEARRCWDHPGSARP
ncbi:hypothetical protein OL239_06805 [Arthrobacter sp. ATA002]|uniref:hypothetical protein n=1 Tax=Arthrobacter sp. ATA002 TaxID=2991715 RepID=UPI0022A718D5|nr:hypothetical protein [Arthrobacter sp. ATA002]WAP52859.1 hypothetical protein OL239_06805 [Arthrobacter sp. ATA002]